MTADKHKDIPSGVFDWLVSTDERVDAVHKNGNSPEHGCCRSQGRGGTCASNQR